MTTRIRCFGAVALALIAVSLAPSWAHAQSPASEGTAAAPADTPSEPPAGEPAAAATTAPVAATPPPPAAPAPTAAGPVRVEGANGTDIKFGLLMQPQYQAASSANGALSGYSQNLYIRRMRILLGGSLFGVIDYFIDTDYPNLFLSSTVAPAMMGGAATQPKNTPGMNIQDAFATWKAMADTLKVDVGYMLPAMAHNAVQGATTLLGFDYFANSFRHSDAFGTSAPPIGRDLGVQLRGLVLGGMLEYRLGFFQGFRDVETATEVGARNFFRITGRVQVNLMDPEKGFFYAGTYRGSKRILSLGLSGDLQSDYKYIAGDVFADMPLGPGVGTAQINVAHWNGGGFVALPSQTAVMGEAGFLLTSLQLSPILRYEHRSGTGLATTDWYGLGVGYWPFGHESNLKAFYTRINAAGAAGVNQFNVQWQIFFF